MENMENGLYNNKNKEYCIKYALLFIATAQVKDQ